MHYNQIASRLLYWHVHIEDNCFQLSKQLQIPQIMNIGDFALSLLTYPNVLVSKIKLRNEV